MQDSYTGNEVGQDPPNKRTRVDSEKADSEAEIDLKEGEEPHGPLVNGEVTVLDNF